MQATIARRGRRFCNWACRVPGMRVDPEARMWSNINTNGSIPLERTGLGPCWEWTGTKRPDGYGVFSDRRDAKNRGTASTYIRAHRLVYTKLVGPIPEGLQIDHLCRNRGCVNPDHLEAVTLRENLLRGEGVTGKRARQTHCKRGHPFDEENTSVSPNGTRHCRTCRCLYAREHRR